MKPLPLMLWVALGVTAACIEVDTTNKLATDDQDGDGFTGFDGDCDDSDPTVFTGADELCDGLDNDCDDAVPGDETDDDGDGFVECEIDAGGWRGEEGLLGGDCDDEDVLTFPGAAEAELHLMECMRDADGDGWGEASPGGEITAGTDCDDSDATLNQDDVDQDDYSSCDGDCADADEFTFPGAAESESETDCMQDADGDGWGEPFPVGVVIAGIDCDDSDATAYPGVAFYEPTLCTHDADGDGYGDAAATSPLDAGTDCDDSDATAYLGRASMEPTLCTHDADWDRYGDSAATSPLDAGTDCDDSDSGVGSITTDADCDGDLTAIDCDDNDSNSTIVLEDGDCDGVLTAADCDDGDANLLAVSGDGDCDGVLTGDDCDDGDATTVNDMDCDGVLTVDDCDDGDATTVNDMDCDGVLTVDDCDDGDVTLLAVADDADCDGVLTVDDCDDGDVTLLAVADDADCDGVLTVDDCEDGDATTVNDMDCDGVLTVDDCDDSDPNSLIVATDHDCDGTPNTIGETSYSSDSYTSLLIQSDTFNGSTSFTDSSSNGHAISVSGAQHSTSRQKLGSSSIYFDGSNDGLSVLPGADFDFGTGPFTIDLWINTISKGASDRFVAGGDDSDGSNQQWFFGKWPGNYLNFGYKSGPNPTGWDYTETQCHVGTWNDDTWYHAAVVREGAIVYFFWNGVLEGTWNIGAAVPIDTGSFGITIGNRWYGGVQREYFHGYMDEIRISKGIARWTTDFAVY